MWFAVDSERYEQEQSLSDPQHTFIQFRSKVKVSFMVGGKNQAEDKGNPFVHYMYCMDPVYSIQQKLYTERKTMVLE